MFFRCGIYDFLGDALELQGSGAMQWFRTSRVLGLGSWRGLAFRS